MPQSPRTPRGNHWTHELVLAALWQLDQAVGYFSEEFEPEHAEEECLLSDAAGLRYQANHFICVFESSACRVQELRQEYDQDSPISTVLRRLARDCEQESEVRDQESEVRSQGAEEQSPAFVLSPWHVSVN